MFDILEVDAYLIHALFTSELLSAELQSLKRKGTREIFNIYVNAGKSSIIHFLFHPHFIPNPHKLIFLLCLKNKQF